MSLHYGDALGYSFLEQCSSPNISSTAPFRGDVTFKIEHSEDTYIVPKMSYISAQIQVVQTREDGSAHCLEPIINAGTRAAPTAISVPYICPCPGSALFQNSMTNIKATTISNFMYAGSVNTLYRMLYETKAEQNLQ